MNSKYNYPLALVFALSFTSLPAGAQDVTINDNTPQVRFIDSNGPENWEIAVDLACAGCLDIFNSSGGNASIGAFLIEPDSADGLLYLDSLERIGINNTNPQATLHVQSRDGMSTQLIVENTLAPTTTAKAIEMFRLVNKGPKAVRAVFDANGSKWALDNNRTANPTAGVKSGRFQIWKIGSGLTQFSVDGFGTGRFAGNSIAVAHINTSSRTRKAGFTAIEPKAVLAQLVNVPITRWHYKHETAKEEHVGPVAEDFRAAFGVGDGEHIATVDADGVALAAIQGLYQLVQEQQAVIQKQQGMLQEQQAKIEQFEQATQALTARLEQENQMLRQELVNRLEALETQVSGNPRPVRY